MNGLEDFVQIDGIIKYGDMIPSGKRLVFFFFGFTLAEPTGNETYFWMDGFALECNDFFYFQEEWDFCLFFGLGDPGNCK